jgi:hypothetical protein
MDTWMTSTPVPDLQPSWSLIAMPAPACPGYGESNTPQNTAIAVDASGHPHITYSTYEQYNAGLHYLAWNGAAWNPVVNVDVDAALVDPLYQTSPATVKYVARVGG